MEQKFGVERGSGIVNALIRLAVSLFALILFVRPATARDKAHFVPDPVLQTPLNTSFKEEIRKEVEKYLGVRYRWGGSSARGVDCSGFIRLIYRDVFGIDLPFTAVSQYSMPIFRTVSLKKLRTGDLIFFSPTVRKRRITHVGIYLSHGHFAHAIPKKGVTVSSFKNRYWRSRIFSTKRMVTGHPTDGDVWSSRRMRRSTPLTE